MLPYSTPVSIVILVTLLICYGSPQSGPADRPISAAAMTRRIIENEVRNVKDDHSHWFFYLTIEKSGHKEVKAIVQTDSGDLYRLIAINGRPLTSEQQRKESSRIQRLAKNRSRSQKLEKDHRKHTAQMLQLLQLVPEALLFSYGAQNANVVHLTFRPNPQFHPYSREARVLNSLSGYIVVNRQAHRIEEVKGHLSHEVRFAGGLAAHLDKGGQFEVHRAEVVPGHWEITSVKVHIKGRALFFRPILVQQTRSRSGFHRVADHLTLAEAADILADPKIVTDIQK